MSEPFDPRDPFEILRSSARAAAVPSVAHVRELGRRRKVRARVVAGVGAVVLLTSGIGAAAAVSNRGGPAPVTQGGDVTSIATPSATANPSATATPSAPVTSLRPPPSPSGGQATTQPPTMTTPPSAGPTVHIALTITSPAGSRNVTYKAVVTGLVWQARTRSGQLITGSGKEQITGTTVRVDGVNVGGSDGGDLQCSKQDLVPERSTWTSAAPIVLTPGVHQLLFQIRPCLLIAETYVTVVVN